MKLSSTLYWVCLKATTIYNCLFFLLPLILCRNLPEHWGIRSKIIFYRPLNSSNNSVICCYKKELFWSIFFWACRSEGKIPFSQALTTSFKEYVKRISLMYQQFQPRPTLLDMYPKKTVLYLYSVIVNKYGERLTLLVIHIFRFVF